MLKKSLVTHRHFSKLKPTPAAGFKLPKEKQNEQLVGHRVYGDTNIFSTPANFNYELRRQNEEKTRHRLIKWLVALSFVPFVMLVMNAEATFKKAGVKEVSKKRRERLDSEHGISRPEMQQDFQKLDDLYRVSEKEEIEKARRIGKSSKQFYSEKELKAENDQQKSSEVEDKISKMKHKFEAGDVSVEETHGDGFSQIAISTKAESPDPRVGGTKIVFDSRLDKAT
jgi:hypothetical protein